MVNSIYYTLLFQTYKYKYKIIQNCILFVVHCFLHTVGLFKTRSSIHVYVKNGTLNNDLCILSSKQLSKMCIIGNFNKQV